jgi:hypothetical protein
MEPQRHGSLKAQECHLKGKNTISYLSLYGFVYALLESANIVQFATAKICNMHIFM